MRDQTYNIMFRRNSWCIDTLLRDLNEECDARYSKSSDDHQRCIWLAKLETGNECRHLQLMETLHTLAEIMKEVALIAAGRKG